MSRRLAAPAAGFDPGTAKMRKFTHALNPPAILPAQAFRGGMAKLINRFTSTAVVMCLFAAAGFISFRRTVA